MPHKSFFMRLMDVNLLVIVQNVLLSQVVGEYLSHHYTLFLLVGHFELLE